MNTHRRLRGGIALADLVRDRRRASGSGTSCAPVQTVRADADLEEVARLMTDFDLTVVPVVDEEERVLGIVTVDDVLELVLPEAAGAAGSGSSGATDVALRSACRACRAAAPGCGRATG